MSTYKWRSSIHGVLVFEDKTYMANGPHKFVELDASTQKINALAITTYESDAQRICEALAHYRAAQLHANAQGVTPTEWLSQASVAQAQRTALNTILAEWRKFAEHPNPANPIACAAVRECIEDLEKVLGVTK